jgi:hypothetical protein
VSESESRKRKFHKETMLGSNNKWMILTVVGVTLASICINAIDSPTKTLFDPEVQSFTNENLGITVENLNKVPKSSRRHLRNLVPPYQEFSNIDRIQLIDIKSRNSKNLPSTFGTFRFDDVNTRSSSPSPFRRRSDEYDDSIGTYPASQIAYDLNYDFDYANEDNTTLTRTGDNDYNTFHNKVIPISFAPNGVVKVSNKTLDNDTDNGKNRESKELDENFNFSSEALTARRSGIQFAENESEVRHQNFNPFVPQSYSEESLNFGDAILNLQRPYHSDETDRSASENENDRSANTNRYYRPFIGPYRDDVTKFGDVSGPVTAFNRPAVRDFTSDQVVFFPRNQYESTGGASYYEPENSRIPRTHFFPPKVYTEYPTEFPASQKYYQQPSYAVKVRQPRVVFPPPDFGPGTTYVGNDNVVFR